MLRTNDRNQGPFNIVELFRRVYLKVQTGEIAVNGFKVTGIFPPNRNVFGEHEYIAAKHGRVENVPQPNHPGGQKMADQPHGEPESELGSRFYIFIFHLSRFHFSQMEEIYLFIFIMEFIIFFRSISSSGCISI